MKTSHYRILVGLMSCAAVVGLVSLIKVPTPAAPTRQSALEFRPDQSDIWDSALTDAPPLAPGAAMRIAMDFMPGVSLPDYTNRWLLDHLTLQRMSFSEGREEWVYVADFYARPDSSPAWKGPLIHFQVPVRFNGSIPEAFIAKIPGTRRIFWWNYRGAGKVSA
jgi:hypothetical protein